MTGNRPGLIFFALWGMDFSWLYGWTAVIMVGCFDQIYPPWGAAFITGSAAILSFFLRRYGTRVYQLAGAHLLLLLLVALSLAYFFERPDYAFFDPSWWGVLWHRSRSPGEWFLLVTALFSGLVFWYAGTSLAWRKPAYTTVSNHFDFGILSLILLFLVEMMMATKGGISAAGPLLPRILCIFFLFSVPAFCLARGSGGMQSQFLTGFRSIGVIFGFLLPILLLGGGIIALFLPYLSNAAKSGVGVLGVVTAPIGNFFLKILLFLYGNSRMRSEPAGQQSDHGQLLQPMASPPLEGWQLFAHKLFLYCTAALIIAAVLLILALIVWQLVWWLSKPAGGQVKTVSPLVFFGRLLALFGRTFLGLFRRRGRPGATADGPFYVYRALTAWGKGSGTPVRPAETPNEYGRRLSARFPMVSDEIGLIVRVQNRFVYGSMITEYQAARPTQLLAAQAACRRLHRPRLWPMRLRALLLR